MDKISDVDRDATTSRKAGTSNAGRGTIRPAFDLRWLNAVRVCFSFLVAMLVGQAFAATVNGLTITENLPQARRGVAYSHTITVSGGTAPYTFTLLAPNDLPASLALSAGGTVDGVVSCTQGNGSHKQSIRITDSSAVPIVADFTSNANQLSINVTAGPAGTCVTLTVDPATLPNPTVGTPYSQTITASGGLAPYTYAVTAGALPAGLSLNASTGAISGTPTSSGAFSFTITATDAAMSTGTRVYSGTTNPAVVITVNPATLINGTVGTAYSQTLSASGGTTPYTFTVTAGSLPAGLSLNSGTGAITGTPTTTATSNFTITATDASLANGSRAYSVTINPSISVNPATLPNGTVGTAYAQTITGSGGTGAFTYSVSAGALPAGLSLNTATGAITGTPTTAATSNFTITATDGLSATGSRAYAVTINPAITVNPATLPNGTVGAAYSQTVSATGGTGTYIFSVTAGSLPAGLSLNSGTGAITGTPTTAATSNFTITATDGLSATGSRAYTMTINAGIVVNPATLPNGSLGSAYSQTVSATGGTGSYTFSITAGLLPGGLSLNGGTGVISGTPTTAATSNFTITATDGLGATGSRAYAVTINSAITVNPAALPNGTVGTAYSQTVGATGGTGAYIFSVTAGSLPVGLSLNSGTGAITGTPTTAATSSFTITATDGLGATGSRAYTVTINAGITVNPATLPNGTVGTAYSQSISATGGTGTYTFSVTAGSLPAGVSLNGGTGLVSGTPTTAATSNFTITATDGLGATGSRAYSVTMNAGITVNPASLPNGTIGVAYSQAISTTGGTGAMTFSVSAGSLPAGLSLNASSGVISGTPSSAATSNFTITATDSLGATGSRAYGVVINSAITVNPASLPSTTLGLAYNQTVSATGGSGTFTFGVSSGSLPAGLALNASTGVISGTSTAAGTSNFTITATDGLGATGSRAYAITVNPALSVNPASLSATTVGVAYSQTVSATGGTGAYTFSVSAGLLPAGLSLNVSTGVISGTPASAGTSNFTITATDSLGATGSRAYVFTVNAAMSVNPASLPGGAVGTAYSQAISVTGGTGAITFAVGAGTLPSGLALNSATGVLSGTPTASGNFNFTVTATDSVGATASRAYSLTVNAGISVNPASLPATTVGAAYSQTISASGGSGTYTFSVTAGSLPAGLSLNAGTGVISGSPGSAGTANFTVTATDTLGATGSRAYSIVVNAAITVNPASLPATTVGVPFSQTVSATGGTGAYTFNVSSGSLPSGLSLNPATGVISGTPIAAGSSSFTITATDGVGSSGSRALSITVNPAITVSPPSLPAGSVGVAYSQMISASGGTGAYTFSVSAGSLPAGVSLNASTGLVSGTPTSAGTSNFTITATDAVGATGVRAYSIAVNGAITVNPASLPSTAIGMAYSQTVSASGGNGVYTFSVSSGSLPAGLSLNASSGVVSGTPTAAGTSNFTITATDGLGATGSRAYSIVVNAAINVNPASLPAGTLGTAYSQTVSATGGSGAFTFSVSAGALPAGLSLNAATGVVSGTPTTAAASNFTITATDGLGATGSRAYSVSVNSAIAINPATLPVGSVGTAYSQTVSAAGGSGAYTFSVSAGSLPPGFVLNPASGVLAGMPGSAASYNFTITSTDTMGASAARAYSLAFNAAITVGPTALPAAAVGTAYSQAVSATGGSGTYTFSVSAGTLPAGLSLNPSTGVITGTPTSGATSNFTITATDGLGFGGSRAYVLTVALPTLTLVAPVPDGTVGSPYNQILAVTGGTAPYSYVVTGGQLPPGLSLNSTSGALTGVPTVSGTYSFTVTATDANGATGTFTQSLSVAARPDPTLDPSVRGAIAAQISAAARFGTAQIGNVTSRMRMLHLGFDPCSTQIDIGINIPWEHEQDSTTGPGAPPNKSSNSQDKKADEQERSRCERPFAVWAGGNVDFGFLRPSLATDRSNFRSSGLTLGADTRLGEGLVVGAALGYARDEIDVNAVGADSNARAQNMMLYASFEPAKSIFIDALLGYGRLSFDAPRWQASDMVLLSGDRDGSQFFGSLGVGAVLRSQDLNIAPYGRFDYVRSRLDAYSESGSASALSYGVSSVSENSIAIGLYLGYVMPVGAATLEPGLRLEQQRVRSGSAEQSLTYADMPATSYWLQQAAESDNRTSAALSLLLRFGFAASLGLEYSYTGSSGTFKNESVRAILRAPF